LSPSACGLRIYALICGIDGGRELKSLTVGPWSSAQQSIHETVLSHATADCRIHACPAKEQLNLPVLGSAQSLRPDIVDARLTGSSSRDVSGTGIANNPGGETAQYVLFDAHSFHPEKKTMPQSQPKPPFPEQGLKPPGQEHKMDPRPKYEADQYRGSDKLQGKVALITGGDSGIGRAVAVLFAREGARVAFTYLPEEETDAQETIDGVRREGQEALGMAGDVRDPSFCSSVVEKTVSRFGRLDILVNNAAYQKHLSGLDQIDDQQWDRTFKTNIYGYFYMARAAVPHMKPGSAIVNCGSETGLEGSGGLLDYSATKGAIHAFTKALAQNLVEKGIRVNCVAPGPVWTPLNPAELPAGKEKDFGSKTALGRPAQPEEIAPAFVFLASNVDSSFISGIVLPLLGGLTTAG
jgi:NAD(P)-dependent dehydrogenase (short-subunit alcohol dehydrogenase family)